MAESLVAHGNARRRPHLTRGVPMVAYWKKLGLVFSASGQTSWLHAYAAVPIAERLDDSDRYRIYFSSRDAANRSFTSYVVIDIRHPQRILDAATAPVLHPGALGEFDDSGAMATWLATHRGQRFLYYIGWNLGVTVPFRNSIGLAIASGAEQPFARHLPGPIVDRSATEPHFCASCCVLPGEDLWRMWYLSCTGWELHGGKPRHRYHLKYAESDDGIAWRRNGDVAIDYADAAEYAISRPCVIRDPDRWRMWYSYRGSAYRIGYAESADGVRWQRLDHLAGIAPSPSGWDSQMIEYPFVFDHEGERYMLYNGNDYGRSGFGLAVLEHG
ncbi:hypothetical protein [Xanthomonas translucens]|uniref:hypothetical protein n=1 Tax=Xanthomonas campestris pv. translucens TaxID=343 RepID=UPI001F508405|nr:hypothetical protein [Xanthomonas translucens]WLA00653.1 hypothetical protein MO330_17910 [Xanthomonas translucens]